MSNLLQSFRSNGFFKEKDNEILIEMIFSYRPLLVDENQAHFGQNFRNIIKIRALNIESPILVPQINLFQLINVRT